MKHHFKYRQKVHTVLGLSLSAINIYAGLYAFDKRDWKFSVDDVHAYFGTAALILGFAQPIGGIGLLLYKNYWNMDWETEILLKRSRFHKALGYFLLFLSQVNIAIGLYKVFPDYLGKLLLSLNTIFFFGVLATCEVVFLRDKKNQTVFNTLRKSMSRKEFEKAVFEDGRKLVILDDLVLDVEEFIPHHPGGKFMISQNVGRDVSKFFYGGYALGFNSRGRRKPGYFHSNYARYVVNKISIAMYEKEIPEQETVCRAFENETELKEDYVNTSTNLVCLQAKDSEVVPNFKRHYPGS